LVYQTSFAPHPHPRCSQMNCILTLVHPDFGQLSGFFFFIDTFVSLAIPSLQLRLTTSCTFCKFYHINYVQYLELYVTHTHTTYTHTHSQTHTHTHIHTHTHTNTHTDTYTHTHTHTTQTHTDTYTHTHTHTHTHRHTPHTHTHTWCPINFTYLH
jgi:hypothetical protein